MKIFIYYIASLISLMVLDWLWLGVITKNYYKEHLGFLFRENFVWSAIILFYLLYAAAIVYFVILPAQGVWTKALVSGALLGFTAYMTYDLVNYATIKNWPVNVIVSDIAWGTVMTAAVAVIAVGVSKLV